MAVLCSHCGEELMGAVNRCWKCGRPIQAHSGPLDVPPIRRSPITGSLHAPLEATVFEATLLEEPTGANAAQPVVRRGSPFETNSNTPRAPSPPPPTEPKLVASRSRRSGSEYASAQLGSIAAMGLAMLAWGVSFRIPVATVFLALFAIGLGIWGLFGIRRGVAIFALLLACSALAWGAFGTLVQVYQMIYGVHPLAFNI